MKVPRRFSFSLDIATCLAFEAIDQVSDFGSPPNTGTCTEANALGNKATIHHLVESGTANGKHAVRLDDLPHAQQSESFIDACVIVCPFVAGTPYSQQKWA